MAVNGRTVGPLRVDNGNSMADRGVVSRSPTLSLITRKFARQSHAGFSESRNAVFYRLRRSVRLGSIPIARSTFRCLACPCVALGRCSSHRPVPTVSTRLQFLRSNVDPHSVEGVLDGLIGPSSDPSADNRDRLLFGAKKMRSSINAEAEPGQRRRICILCRFV